MTRLSLPTANGQPLIFGHRAGIDTDHRLAQVTADLGQELGIVVVRYSLNDGLGATRRIAAFEDAAAHKYAIHAKLHHQRGVRWSRHATSREIDHRQTATTGHFYHQIV